MFNTLTNAVETTIASSETTTEVVKEAAEIAFTTENIRESLLCAGAGMVGIFIVIGIIILSVSILNRAGAEKKRKD